MLSWTVPLIQSVLRLPSAGLNFKFWLCSTKHKFNFRPQECDLLVSLKHDEFGWKVVQGKAILNLYLSIILLWPEHATASFWTLIRPVFVSYFSWMNMIIYDSADFVLLLNFRRQTEIMLKINFDVITW